MAQFSGTVTSPLAIAAVIGAGGLLRWKPWRLRVAAGSLGLLLGLPAAMEAGTFAQVISLIAVGVAGALVLAELVLTVLVPLGRLLVACWAIACDVGTALRMRRSRGAARVGEAKAAAKAAD